MILKTFFSGFGIPAYAENSVPEEIQLPYITYPLIQPEWDEQASFYVQVWYRKNNLSALLSKADQITAAIGNGARFDFNGGIIELFTSTPKIQTLTDEDSQRAYINMIIRAYCNPGE
jgi:hypothetical protein